MLKGFDIIQKVFRPQKDLAFTPLEASCTSLSPHILASEIAKPIGLRWSRCQLEK
jgi:hypothetical protein